VAELIEEAEAIEVGVAEVGPLRERAAAAGAWAADALAHLARFPATAAQPKDALPAARELIQAWPPAPATPGAPVSRKLLS